MLCEKDTEFLNDFLKYIDNLSKIVTDQELDNYRKWITDLLNGYTGTSEVYYLSVEPYVCYNYLRLKYGI